jgi:hypothetical protein
MEARPESVPGAAEPGGPNFDSPGFAVRCLRRHDVVSFAANLALLASIGRSPLAAERHL